MFIYFTRIINTLIGHACKQISLGKANKRESILHIDLGVGYEEVTKTTLPKVTYLYKQYELCVLYMLMSHILKLIMLTQTL